MSDDSIKFFLSLDIELSDNGQRGRLFYNPGISFEKQEELIQNFRADFAHEMEEPHIDLLGKLLSFPDPVIFEVFPGEGEDIVEHHVYLKTPKVDSPVFVCVLGSSALIRQHISSSCCIFELPLFQYIGDSVSKESVESGLKVWIGRVFPHISIPPFEVHMSPGVLPTGYFGCTGPAQPVQ